jgi:hypothetical protein
VGEAVVSNELVTGLFTVAAAVAGAVAGAFGNAFAPALQDLIPGRPKPYKHLIGEWNCEWSIDVPTSKKERIRDAVTIQSISGERVKAVGVTPSIGRYRLTGRVSPSNLLTLFYEGVGDARLLGGVVILDVDAGGKEMKGYWYEYMKDRKCLGGTTRWRKSRAS